jgi:hypothetical protein
VSALIAIARLVFASVTRASGDDVCTGPEMRAIAIQQNSFSRINRHIFQRPNPRPRSNRLPAGTVWTAGNPFDD